MINGSIRVTKLQQQCGSRGLVLFRQSRQGAQRFLKQGQQPELPDQDGPLIMELPVGSRYAHTPARFSPEKIHGISLKLVNLVFMYCTGEWSHKIEK